MSGCDIRRSKEIKLLLQFNDRTIHDLIGLDKF